jgi:VIT1/CCC1 family predicted Fe2+/Mn2+ transporter
VFNNPDAANDAVMEIFEPWGIPASVLDEMSSRLSKSPHLVDFIMKFQHCAEKPDSSRAIVASITIALGYFLGGLLPLLPYIFVGRHEVYKGLYMSIGVMVVALFVFGYTKTCVVIGWRGGKKIRSGCVEGVKMVVVGSIAAAAAMGLVKFFSRDEVTMGIASIQLLTR